MDGSPSIRRNKPPVVKYYKRRIRQRPLTKVLESTVMVSVPVTCDALVNSDSSPPRGFSESQVSAVNNFAGITTAAFTTSSPTKALVSGQTRRFGQSSRSDFVKNEGSNGSGCANPAATLFNEIEKSTLKWHLKGKRSSRQMSNKQEERRNAFVKANKFLPHCSISDQKLKGHFSFGTRAMGRTSEMYNVKIEVKADYKPGIVPLISLRRQLNDEAVVGHPLTVDVFEDGSRDRIVSSHLKPLGVRSSKRKAKKKKSHIPLYDKPSKSKKSPSLSIKTRSLSALNGQKLTASSKKKMLIEKSKERIVACIPLKIAFSRINEALKGSTRQVHRTLPSAGST